MAIAPIELQKHLKGIDYPANKQKLIETARRGGAGREIIDLLQRFPDRDFGSPREVMEAYGDLHQGSG